MALDARHKSTGFGPVKDLDPVGSVATAGQVLVTHPSFHAKNTVKLVALARQQPDKLNI